MPDSTQRGSRTPICTRSCFLEMRCNMRIANCQRSFWLISLTSCSSVWSRWRSGRIMTSLK
eukprot:6416356-Alexandrium_andersonii.AAC.1